MKKYILIATIISLLFICCNKKNNNWQEAEYTIEVNTNNLETFDLSNNTLFDKFIPLETTENSLIKEIEKIYFSDSTIIVFDESSSEIFLFNSSGSFIRKCGVKGTGPGEHIYFSDIYYDQYTEQIFAYEGQRRSMYIYNLAGDLKETISTSNIWFRSFCKVEDGYWLYTGMPNEGYDNSVLKVDNSFNIIKGFIPQKTFFTTYWRSTFFQNEKDELFFISPYGNIVYQIEEDELNPYFEINFDKNSPPFRKIPELTDETEYNSLAIGDDFYGNIHNFLLYKDLFYFNFSTTGDNAKIYFACFNTDKDNTIVFDSFAEYKRADFPYNNITFIQPQTIYKDNYICLINPYRLTKESIDRINETSKFKISEDSNPLLFFLKIIE